MSTYYMLYAKSGRTQVIQRLLSPLFAALVLLGCQWAAAAQRQPNVILIMTDDQGYGDLGVHGNTMLKTSSLDKLARESVRMSDFHVNPTCAETRAALMTGRYSCRTGVWHTINGRSLLRPEELTMPEAFAANGYATGMFGKWHLGDNYPFFPHQRGFQTTLAHGGGGVQQTPDAWGNDYFDDTYFRNGKPETQQGYCTDVFFDASLDFIEQHRDQPFFCYIATNAAHSPFLVPQKYAQPYLDQGVPQPMANFYGMITNIDENVGKLLGKLDEWDLTENTIFVFMADNGTAAGVLTAKAKVKAEAEAKENDENDQQQNKDEPTAIKWSGYDGGLRGIKASQYEGGHRVPFIVRWPAGNITGGRTASTLAAQFDLLPTFIDLCNLKLPREVEFDGQSLKKTWQSETADPALNGRTLFVQSQRVDHPIKWRHCAVMHNQWRLVDGAELYNLKTDLAQTQNIASKHPDLVAQLRQSYETWWASVSARFDEPVRIQIGNAAAPTAILTAHDWHATNNVELPWNQPQVKSDPPANGYWLLDVKQQGKYQFTLRSRPKNVPFAFASGQARLEITDQPSQWQNVAVGDESITFQATLQVGPTRLQTWVPGRDAKKRSKPRGAFFVEIERL